MDARILRNTLARSGAILEISLDGAKGAPVLVKDVQRHPVRGEAVHVDFLRVDMNETIQTTVAIELTGIDEAPGVVEGGVLSQDTREVLIEALPGDIPDSIVYDVSGLEMNGTVTLDALVPPKGVTLVGEHAEDAVIATITPPTAEPVEEEIETETGLVGAGEGEAAEEAEEESAADSGEAS